MRGTDESALCAFVITIIHIQQLHENCMSVDVCHVVEFSPPEPRSLPFQTPHYFVTFHSLTQNRQISYWSMLSLHWKMYLSLNCALDSYFFDSICVTRIRHFDLVSTLFHTNMTLSVCQWGWKMPDWEIHSSITSHCLPCWRCLCATPIYQKDKNLSGPVPHEAAFSNVNI